jgi:hypothetical protein
MYTVSSSFYLFIMLLSIVSKRSVNSFVLRAPRPPTFSTAAAAAAFSSTTSTGAGAGATYGEGLSQEQLMQSKYYIKQQ